MMETMVSQRDFITLLGIKIDRLDLEGLMKRINKFLKSSQRFKVMYVNIHCMNAAFKDSEYKKIINSADLVYCDGAGVVIGASILGLNLPGRMTGADWIYDLCKICTEKEYSVYLLGGETGIAEDAGNKLVSKFPNLRIVGTFNGHFEESYNNQVIEKINLTRPDIVLVGMGSPKQEKWINENFGKLNAKIVWGIGALMDFVTGKVSRAPKWMLDNGLEWLYRLIVEPRRLWRRYVLGNPLFFFRILKERLRGSF